MDLLRQAKKTVTHLGLAMLGAARKVNRGYHRRLGRRNGNPQGEENVLVADWDNLIILNACRYDYFTEYEEQLSGTFSKRISSASATKEFMWNTITEWDETDLVYVFTNAWWAWLADGIDSTVHEFVNLEEENIQDPILDVELPETVTDRAIEEAERYPNKRLLVHYNQPHYPYIGELGGRLFPGENRNVIANDVSKMVMTVDQVQAVNRENMDAVIPEVVRLVDHLEVKTVVTADHGKMLGERGWPIPVRDYGHLWGIHIPELSKSRDSNVDTSRGRMASTRETVTATSTTTPRKTDSRRLDTFDESDRNPSHDFQERHKPTT